MVNGTCSSCTGGGVLDCQHAQCSQGHFPYNKTFAACTPCTAQPGCLDSTDVCSTVPGLESKLTCQPAKGDAGYFVDVNVTAQSCPPNTHGLAFEESTTTCTGCAIPNDAFVAAGVDEWSDGCEAGGVVFSGTECTVKANSAFTCRSPGMCADGFFANAPGLCNEKLRVPCDEGFYYTYGNGAWHCAVCDPGFYCPLKKGELFHGYDRISCKDPTFKHEFCAAGSVRPERCDSLTANSMPNAEHTECVCACGYFAHVDAKTEVLTCVRCPTHGALCGKTGTKFAERNSSGFCPDDSVCPGTTLDNMRIDAGFWQDKTIYDGWSAEELDPTSGAGLGFERCRDIQVEDDTYTMCLGGTDWGACVAEHSGVVCAVCREGFVLNPKGLCVVCDEDAREKLTLTFFGTVAGVMLVGWLVWQLLHCTSKGRHVVAFIRLQLGTKEEVTYDTVAEAFEYAMQQQSDQTAHEQSDILKEMHGRLQAHLENELGGLPDSMDVKFKELEALIHSACGINPNVYRQRHHSFVAKHKKPDSVGTVQADTEQKNDTADCSVAKVDGVDALEIELGRADGASGDRNVEGRPKQGAHKQRTSAVAATAHGSASHRRKSSWWRPSQIFGNTQAAVDKSSVPEDQRRIHLRTTRGLRLLKETLRRNGCDVDMVPLPEQEDGVVDFCCAGRKHMRRADPPEGRLTRWVLGQLGVQLEVSFAQLEQISARMHKEKRQANVKQGTLSGKVNMFIAFYQVLATLTNDQTFGYGVELVPPATASTVRAVSVVAGFDLLGLPGFHCLQLSFYGRLCFYATAPMVVVLFPNSQVLE